MINETRIYFAFPRRISNVIFAICCIFSYFYSPLPAGKQRHFAGENGERSVSKTQKKTAATKTERYSD